MVMLFILFVGGVYIGALISIITSPAGKGMKCAWVIFVLMAPLLGIVLWFLVGRPQARSAPVAL
ncbi:hypothetical protein ADL21_20610 [Streptomyces albus subsp. albus]|nr:hypothetical protein ADL21_20610 [Streptomyces albus subsp. albus]